MSKSTKLVGAVAIYGTHRCGHGWIADAGKGRMFGNSEPRAERSATEALWLGCEALHAAGITSGRIAVTIDTDVGSMIAITDVARPGYFGALDWKMAAPAVVVSPEAVQAAAVRS